MTVAGTSSLKPAAGTKGDNLIQNEQSENKRATWLVSRATRTGSELLPTGSTEIKQFNDISIFSNNSKSAPRPLFNRASWLPSKRHRNVLSNGRDIDGKGAGWRPSKRYKYRPENSRRKYAGGILPSNQRIMNGRASWLPIKRISTAKETALKNKLADKEHHPAFEVNHKNVTSCNTKEIDSKVGGKRRTRRDVTASQYGWHGEPWNDDSAATGADDDEPPQSSTKTKFGHFINGRRSSATNAKLQEALNNEMFKNRLLLFKSKLARDLAHGGALTDLTAGRTINWLKAKDKRTPMGSASMTSSNGHGSPLAYNDELVYDKRMPTRGTSSFFPDDDVIFRQPHKYRFQRMFLPEESGQLYSRMPTRGTYDSDRFSRMPTRDSNDNRFFHMPTRDSNDRFSRMPTRDSNDRFSRMPTRDSNDNRFSRMPTRDSNDRFSRMPTRDSNDDRFSRMPTRREVSTLLDQQYKRMPTRKKASLLMPTRTIDVTDKEHTARIDRMPSYMPTRDVQLIPPRGSRAMWLPVRHADMKWTK